MTPDEMIEKMSFKEIVQAAKDGNQDAIKQYMLLESSLQEQGKYGF